VYPCPRQARTDGPLSAGKERRYERPVGTLAGEPGVFERKRQEREQAERETEAAERARLASMPVRTYAGKGGAFLPGYLLSWLLDEEDDSLNVTDVGVLATFLLTLEHGRSPFARSEVVDGRIVLDNATGFAFLPCANPNADLGERRVRDSVRYLAGNDWLDIGRTSDGRTSIGCGERARKLIEEATAAPLP
jgi:hypothetical protein